MESGIDMNSLQIAVENSEDAILRSDFEDRWDFEVLLSELRANPVLEIMGSKEKVFALECRACAQA